MTGQEATRQTSIRIGSRGSQLALWQAHHIAALLRGRGHEVEIEVIKTSGDRMQNVTFAEVGQTVPKGMFTLEIEEALAAGRVDLAVHSLKDLPTRLPEGFVLGATPERADARDVVVSKEYGSFAELPAGVKVGTSSSRRRAQLRHLRPDLEYVEFRGNVDTRLRKLEEGRAAAILLAAAGLDRLERTEWIRERLEPEVLCPAAGQGALGIEIRDGDARMMEVVGFLDDPVTRFCVTAERVALAGLGGGCQVPIGVHCRLDAFGSDEYAILGVVAGYDSRFSVETSLPIGRLIRGEARGKDAEALGLELAGLLKSQGASEILEEIGTH